MFLAITGYHFKRGELNMFKVSFFIKEKEQELFPLLQPLRFSVNREHKAIWNERGSEFVIQPFSGVGRESQGYRAYFNGTPEAFQYLFDFALSCFSPTISGIEYHLTTDKSQAELIRLAERSRCKKGGMYGLYHHNGVWIAILPNNRVTLQIRNRKVKQADLARVMQEIESVVDIFSPQEFNLFSFEKYSEEGAYVS